jgi:hypothetical protein
LLLFSAAQGGFIQSQNRAGSTGTVGHFRRGPYPITCNMFGYASCFAGFSLLTNSTSDGVTASS